MQSIRRIALAGFLIAMMLVATVQAQVTQYIPSKSMVVFKISKLDATSKKLAAFIQQMGLAQMDPRLADPLGSFLEEKKVTKGVNKEGDLAFAVLSFQKEAVEAAEAAVEGEEEPMEEQSVLLLIPVSDYDQFLSNFTDVETEDGISKAVNPDGEGDSYIAHWGDYAAMSPRKSNVSTKPDGITLQGLAAKEFETKDTVIWANIPALREQALPELEKNRDKIVADITKGLTKQTATNQAFEPLAKAAANQLVNAAERYLKDGQAATFSINIGEKGLSTTLMTEFEPTSYLGQTVAQVKNSDQSLTAGLPDENYIVTGGVVIDNEVITKLLNDAMDPILKEAAALEAQGKPITDYYDVLKSVLAATNSETFGLIAPTAAIGQGSLIQGLAIVNGDSKAIIKAQKEMIDMQAELTKLFQSAQPPAQTTYTADAKTVDGVVLNQFQTKFNPNPKTPQERQIAQLMALMYGPQGAVGYIGAVSDNQTLLVTGLTDEQIKASIDAAKTGNTSVAERPHVASVTSELPKNRVGEVYVSLDVLLSTAANYAKQFGANMPLNLQPNLPPIGVTLATEASAVRVDSYVPSQLVQQMVAAGMQMFMGMQGGGPEESTQPGDPSGL
ncbi:MAG: hypothetical protein IT447_16175 [Phycisphaerales bacterium]|jgi:hypothetical protein|nr:hypothetical protein [Phycisphaerales bacterium]